MADGRTFSRAGVIHPGDVLTIPLPSIAIEEQDGLRFYVVEPGDTLSGIAACVLGDPAWFPEIFALNVGVARLGERGVLGSRVAGIHRCEPGCAAFAQSASKVAIRAVLSLALRAAWLTKSSPDARSAPERNARQAR